MIIALRFVSVIIALGMTYIVVTTSLESNLFAEWDFLGQIPWMRATLWDFYANVFFIFIWVAYKERTWLMRSIWLILLVCLGSIATAAYVAVQAFKTKPEDGLSAFLLRSVKS